MLFCAISGEPPQDPVVSSKSGHVYERRLIIKYITENGTDPITAEKLEESDLITVKTSAQAAPPRPPSHSSIPALLHTLQNEWDALMLETFTLRQQYNSTRQELSYALYAQDAATRVVARLLKERDAAREALSNVQATMGATPAAPAEDVEMVDEPATADALPESIVAQIAETHQALSAVRKKRKTPPGYPSAAEIKTFTAKHTIQSLHASSPAGITALALSTSSPSQFLTGGNDKVVQLYDRDTDKVLATLKGHTKKVKHVAFREREGHPTLILSGGADKLAKIWSHDSTSGEYMSKSTIRTHKGEITGLVVLPTSTILALSSLDKAYSIHDLSDFRQVYRSPPFKDPLTSMSTHPDGTLLGLGTSSSEIHFVDIRAATPMAAVSIPGDSQFAVNSLSFSENGYQLLTPYSSSSMAVWDLRKRTVVHTFPLGDSFNLNKVLYDQSALYLGAAGSGGIKLFLHKTWEELVHFEDGEVSDLAFGRGTKEIWGVGGRQVTIWAAPS